MEIFYVKIGSNQQINISKIKYIVLPEQYEQFCKKLKIACLFKEDKFKVLSYIIIEDLNAYYAYECIYSTDTIVKRINEITKKRVS